MDMANHCAAFSGLSRLNTRAVPANAYLLFKYSLQIKENVVQVLRNASFSSQHTLRATGKSIFMDLKMTLPHHHPQNVNETDLCSPFPKTTTERTRNRDLEL
jgi:hypothetical protein